MEENGRVPSVNAAVMVREMPAEERPRERLARYGADVLASAELIAILLRTGTAGTDVMAVADGLLVRDFGGLEGLARASVAEMSAVPGIGPAKAAELKAAITLGVRAASVSPDSRAQLLKSPEDVADLHAAPRCRCSHREHVRVVLNLERAIAVAARNRRCTNGSVHQAHVRYGSCCGMR